MKYFRIFSNGVLKENPVLVLLLGLTPALAVTTSVINAVGMGAATMVVLLCSNVVISSLSKFIPDKVRTLTNVVIIAGFVSLIEMVMRVYFYELSSQLGFFVPLIVVNTIFLTRTTAFAAENSPLMTLLDSFGFGIGFTAALVLVAVFREILGAGTIWGVYLFGEYAASALVLPPGAFLTLGILLAVINAVKSRRKERSRTS